LEDNYEKQSHLVIGYRRWYTIMLKVTDASGNSGTATATVTVPHSQNGTAAVDDGPHYTVSSNCP
jgi:hypothetical protein